MIPTAALMHAERERLKLRADVAALKAIENDLRALPVDPELLMWPRITLLCARGALLWRLWTDDPCIDGRHHRPDSTP